MCVYVCVYGVCTLEFYMFLLHSSAEGRMKWTTLVKESLGALVCVRKKMHPGVAPTAGEQWEIFPKSQFDCELATWGWWTI